jgi:hypothetical protein
VTVYRLITRRTVEERILERAKQKAKIQSLVIGGGKLEMSDENIWQANEMVDLLLEEEQDATMMHHHGEEALLRRKRTSVKRSGGFVAAPRAKRFRKTTTAATLSSDSTQAPPPPPSLMIAGQSQTVQSGRVVVEQQDGEDDDDEEEEEVVVDDDDEEQEENLAAELGLEAADEAAMDLEIEVAVDDEDFDTARRGNKGELSFAAFSAMVESGLNQGGGGDPSPETAPLHKKRRGRPPKRRLDAPKATSIEDEAVEDDFGPLETYDDA